MAEANEPELPEEVESALDVGGAATAAALDEAGYDDEEDAPALEEDDE